MNPTTTLNRLPMCILEKVMRLKLTFTLWLSCPRSGRTTAVLVELRLATPPFPRTTMNIRSGRLVWSTTLHSSGKWMSLRLTTIRTAGLSTKCRSPNLHTIKSTRSIWVWSRKMMALSLGCQSWACGSSRTASWRSHGSASNLPKKHKDRYMKR